MIYFLLPQLTHKNSILYYEVVKVTINTPALQKLSLT